MSLGSLEIVAIAEVAVATSMMAGISGHFAHARRRTRREAPTRKLVLDSLRDVALDAAEPDPSGAELSRVPARLQVTLLTEILRPLGRVERERVATVAETAGVVRRAERWCASRRWWRRVHGARLLSMLGRGADVIPALLGDPSAEVRAEAAAWAASSREPEVIEGLLDMLGDHENICRYTVKDSLLRIGRPVVEPLAQRLSTLDGLALREALTVAAPLAESRLLEPALTHLAHAEPAVRALAVDVVGRTGGRVAIDRVGALLDDPDPAPRASAARALGHLGHWPAGTRLAALLRDPSWDVRRAAGVALHGLGAPGVLLLRRALNDEDRFAADMARQLLEIPPAVDLEALA